MRASRSYWRTLRPWMIPLTSTSNFDSGLLINDEDVAQQYVEHVRQAYLGSEHLTTHAALEKLEVLR
ncbi:MAG: hypothetical protein HYR62_00965 [Actinobacteria bacterium]|nr:hypothetical protein [Actinomycetota bacterium]